MCAPYREGGFNTQYTGLPLYYVELLQFALYDLRDNVVLEGLVHGGREVGQLRGVMT
jgi:hypothetical protein